MDIPSGGGLSKSGVNSMSWPRARAFTCALTLKVETWLAGKGTLFLPVRATPVSGFETPFINLTTFWAVFTAQ